MPRRVAAPPVSNGVPSPTIVGRPQRILSHALAIPDPVIIFLEQR